MASKKNATDRYASRGVSSSKEEVHAAVGKLDRGLFPNAFCKITKDYLTGSKSRCNVIPFGRQRHKVNQSLPVFQRNKRRFRVPRHFPRLNCDEH